MDTTRARALLLAAFLLPGPAGAGSGVGYEEYSLKKKTVEAAKDTVARFEERVARTTKSYDRLQAQRQLEMARKALRDAQRKFDDVRKKIEPGSRAFQEETRVESGRRPTLEEIAATKTHDPMAAVYGRSQETKGGSTGEVMYNKPPSALNQGRVDPQRWKVRPAPGESEAQGDAASPAASAQAGPARPGSKQYVVAPGKLGGGGGAGYAQGGGVPAQTVDFVGKKVTWNFVPFGHEDSGKQGAIRGETLEESALVKAALGYMKEGNPLSALGKAERLVKLRPDDPRVFHLRALLLNRLRRYPEAEAAAESALRLGMEHPEVYDTLAAAQLGQGKYDDAVKSARRSLDLDPEREFPHTILASAYKMMGRSEEAQRHTNAAVSISARRPASAAGPAGGALNPVSQTPLSFASGAAEERPVEKKGSLPWGMIGVVLSATVCVGGGFYLLNIQKKS